MFRGDRHNTEYTDVYGYIVAQALGKLSLSEVEILHVQSPRATTNTGLEIDQADQKFSVSLSKCFIMLLCRL